MPWLWKPYRSIGFCIYCGSTKPPLTREHVLPRGLGGDHNPLGSHEAVVLQRASCEDCREITRTIEENVLRGMDNFRNIYGMKRKDRSIENIVAPYINALGHHGLGIFSPKDVGASILLPIFGKSGGLPYGEWKPERGDKIEIVQDRTELHSIAILKPFSPNFALLSPCVDVAHEVKLSVEAFSKMLAKIALGYAVFRYGPNTFYPIISDYIRGKDNNLCHLIGGFGDFAYHEPKSNDLHAIQTHIRHSRGTLCPVVYIRLFAAFGGPTYYVHVGPLKNQKLHPRDF